MKKQRRTLIFLIILLVYPYFNHLKAQWNLLLYFDTHIDGIFYGNGSFDEANFITPGSGIYLFGAFVSPSSGLAHYQATTSDTGKTWIKSGGWLSTRLIKKRIEAVRKQKTYIFITSDDDFLSVGRYCVNDSTYKRIFQEFPVTYIDYSAIDTSHFYLLYYAGYPPEKVYLDKYENGKCYKMIDTLPYNYGYSTVMYFPDTTTGYISTSNTIIKSTNGGRNWSEVFFDLNVHILKIYFTSADTGYVACSEGLVLNTTNGGDTWKYINTGRTEVFNCMYFLNDTVGFIAGDNGLIIRTTDGGLSWKKDTTGTTDSFYRIFFMNDTVGYAITKHGGLFHTIYKHPVSVPKLTDNNIKLSIYPNPVSENLIIKTGTNKTLKYFLRIFNTIGEEVLSKKIEFNNLYKLDLKNFNAGVYFVKLDNEKENYAKKIVIQK